MSQRDWERLRRMITRRVGHTCEACGTGEDREQRRWLEAHERWSYDEHTGVQALRRLICLCSACHLATHMGHANVTGRAGPALAHLRAVTGMTQSEAWEHVEHAGQLWQHRSRRTWSLDLSILTDAGVTLARPEAPADRAATARRALTAARVGHPPPNPPSARPAAGTTPPARSGPASTVPPSAHIGPHPDADQPRRTWWRRFLDRT